tara:strand:+ start:265 stop:651 length:387 start_codon:yes stop_codon:yes gene_type:complete
MIRVVIAEDEPTVAKTIARCMLSLGYHPVICSDGQRALNVIEDNPDTKLLITDVSMPNFDGRDLVQRLQANEKFSKIPTIVISGLVSVAEIAHLVDNGVTYFLGKPVNLEDLKEHARSLVEHDRHPVE